MRPAPTNHARQWNISTALLLEYEAVLKREQHRQGRPLVVIDRFLDDLVARAYRHAIFYLIRPFLADPDGELILELALRRLQATLSPSTGMISGMSDVLASAY
jgi:hypothetical protein